MANVDNVVPHVQHPVGSQPQKIILLIRTTNFGMWYVKQNLEKPRTKMFLSQGAHKTEYGVYICRL